MPLSGKALLRTITSTYIASVISKVKRRCYKAVSYKSFRRGPTNLYRAEVERFWFKLAEIVSLTDNLSH